MQKNVIALLAILSIGSMTIYANDMAKNANVPNEEIANEQYEPVATISVYVYSKGHGWFYDERTLYAGVKTSNSYYLTDGKFYYPVRKNTIRAYQQQDVSGYDWVCTAKDTRYFFNY